MGCLTFSFRTINSCLMTIPYVSNLSPSAPPPSTSYPNISVLLWPTLLKNLLNLFFHMNFFINLYLLIFLHSNCFVICLKIYNRFKFFIQQLLPPVISMHCVPSVSPRQPFYHSNSSSLPFNICMPPCPSNVSKLFLSRRRLVFIPFHVTKSWQQLRHSVHL